MLEVYTYLVPRPPGSIDVSLLPLDSLASAALELCAHQRDIVLWFGYLEGWMLNPREEVLLRKALRTFRCIVVTRAPLSLSIAWQNEIETIYTADPNGASYPHYNGGAVYDGSQAGHNSPSYIPTSGFVDHQD